MVLNTAPNVSLTDMLSRMINTYYSIKDSQTYQPISSSIHVPKPVTNILTVTWFNDLGLWFISTKHTLPNIHIDAQYIMDTIRQPYVGLELHALLLLLADRYDHALAFDQSLKPSSIDLPSLLPTARYNTWGTFNDHINSLKKIKDIIYEHQR